MPIGQLVTIIITQDEAHTVSFGSVSIASFNHPAGAVTATTAYKEDFIGDAGQYGYADHFVVKVAYPSTALPGNQDTDHWTAVAKNAVNAKYGNGEAGTP